MYCSCGRVDQASKVFDGMANRDVVSWTSMIGGAVEVNRPLYALRLFDSMQSDGVTPNDVTVVSVLGACAEAGALSIGRRVHQMTVQARLDCKPKVATSLIDMSAGWVTEGYRIYNYMHRYGLRPKIRHYGCMVDLLARAGHLDEAEGFLRRMPIEPDSVFGSYVLIGNIYASMGDWGKKARIWESMASKKINKLPAHKIYEKINEMMEKLKLEGYHPKASEVLLDMEDNKKVLQLHHHSERLAVAFGLLSTNPGEKILVAKNLRSCEDCHTVMKHVSKVYDREITVRDRIRFHHFVNGSCSCRDFW
ncbi:Pentatricopeptide repeat-containing protein [Musa troglodytarum]|uniref:Pentatricopeptide repeat-containing protein n=1 Tax=Musa troglodytarum TaxID=320322 RepID=A0A9E7JZN3_9LILI|nr:Pentatricopeptide repeat-containing protein [Musa troglodytarum]